jgi:hypothetical protein
MSFRPRPRQLVSKDETKIKKSSDFRDKVTKFALLHKIPVRLLEAEDRGILTEVVNTMKDAEGKPEYTELYNIIREAFSDITGLKPDTVGALLAGCSTPNADGCSVLCAGSIYAPPVNGGTPCEYSVIYCTRKGEFQLIRGTVLTKAVLYVIGLDESILNTTDYNVLAANGVEELKVHVTDGNGNIIKNVTDDKFVKVSELINRCGGNNTKHQSSGNKKKDSFGWGWLIVVLLLLLLLGVIIWCLYRSYGNNEANYYINQE